MTNRENDTNRYLTFDLDASAAAVADMRAAGTGIGWSTGTELDTLLAGYNGRMSETDPR